MCSVVLQSRHVGDVVLIGSLLCLYCCKNGDRLLILSYLAARSVACLLTHRVISCLLFQSHFVRHNTPHPKDMRGRFNKMFGGKDVDGHIIPHKPGKVRNVIKL